MPGVPHTVRHRPRENVALFPHFPRRRRCPPGRGPRHPGAGRGAERLAETAELAAQAVLVHAEVRQQPGVLRVIGIDLAGDLLGLAVVTLAFQELDNLALLTFTSVPPR